jgi:hypothetical protein
MKGWLILSAALVSVPLVTDMIVDYQFRQMHAEQNIGYSQKDADALDHLIDRVNGEGTAKKRHAKLSGSDEQVALRYLWGDGQ